MKELNQKEISNVAGMGRDGAYYGAIVGAVAGIIVPLFMPPEDISVRDRLRIARYSKFGFAAIKVADMSSIVASLGVLVSMGVGSIIEDMLPKARKG